MLSKSWTRSMLSNSPALFSTRHTAVFNRRPPATAAELGPTVSGEKNLAHRG